MQFVDLAAHYARYRSEMDSAIAGVLSHGRFVMGPEVAKLEAALAAFTGARHAVSCSSGTDALVMIMMADGVGPGDAVFVPSFTFTATAEVPLLLGATPVFVDVDGDDFTMDPEDLEHRIAAVMADGILKPRGILAVDLFGLAADYARIDAIAETHELTVWADAAQSMGGADGTRKVGTLARATATSFFPAKPLGCYGDGGAVFTDDNDMADVMRSIRAHGRGATKYDIQRIGLNARMDTIQAAVLLAKLPHFAGEIEAREAVAKAYDRRLGNRVRTPARRGGKQSAWAQYTLRLPGGRRDAIAAAMKDRNIPTAIYYPVPMHLQTAYEGFGGGKGSLPTSEALCGEVLSLPMHPFLEESEIDRICDALLGAL